MDEVACTGSEPTLISCSHSGWGTHDCGHSEDVGIVCGAEEGEGMYGPASIRVSNVLRTSSN